MNMKKKIVLLFIGLPLVSLLLTVIILSYQNTITPQGIVIHHSAVPSLNGNFIIDAKIIDSIHYKRGYRIFYWGKFYHIGYHYVILPDGTLQQGRPETLQGAHTLGNNDKIGICLIGKFTKNNTGENSSEPNHPTPQQIKTLVELLDNLTTKYKLNKSQIYTHNQFKSETECPGENFSLENILFSVNNIN